MAHDHTHDHAGENIKMAFWLNLSFSVIEIFGGLLTNSIAIISDALHDLGDSFSLAMAWYFQKLSKKGGNPRFTYGYRRFSLLGALINSLVLLVGSGFVILAAVGRIMAPQQANAAGMLALAVMGVLFNGVAVMKLKKGNSLNERAVMLHLMEDVLGWAAVLVASLVMMVVHVPVLDPVLSLLISCYILFNIYRNLRDTLRVILQGAPEGIDRGQIEKLIVATPGVDSVHDIHLWSMDGDYNVMTAHVVTDGKADPAALKCDLKKKLAGAGINHPTIELESRGESCPMDEGCC